MSNFYERWHDTKITLAGVEYTVYCEAETLIAYKTQDTPTDIVVTDTNGQPVKFYGLPVTSDGNVTIGSQQYLSDVLTDNGDGTATIERNTGHIASYDGETITADYLSTTGGLDTGAEIVYLLSESTTETVTITKNKAMNGTTIITSDCPYIGAEYYSWEREDLE